MKPTVSKVKVDDKAWKQLARHLKSIKREGASIRVGVLSSATREDGADMVVIAAVHEFGSPSIGVPERSFIRSGIREERDSLVKLLNVVARSIVGEKMTVDEGLGRLGLWAQTVVRKKIISGTITPPLAASTIARKGSDKPLIDTGQLVNSITWEIAK